MKTVIRIAPLMLVSAWFWNSGVAAQTLPEPKGAIQQLAYSPDGTRIAVADDSAEVWLYDAHALTAVGVLQGHTRKVTAVAFSPEGRLLASAGQDKTVRLWEVSQRKAVGVLEGHTSDVTSVAFSPDGKVLASGSGDRTVRLWEVSQQKEMAVLKGHKSSVTAVAFSPDGRLLASGSLDKTVRLWEVDQQKEVGVLQGHAGSVTAVAFSPDGRLLASGSLDKTVRLWEVDQRQEVAVLSGHTDKVTSVAFSPDGQVLASSSADSTIGVWDVAQRAEIAILRGHRDGVLSVVFSPDGTRLVSGGGDNDDIVRLWEVPSYREVASFKRRFRGYVILSTVYSPALVGNPAGVPDTRPYAIYLPPSYDASDRRYPVIYYLHGAGGTSREGLKFKPTIDHMIREGKIQEMVVVFVDGTSKLDNVFYRNSTEVGEFATYIDRDLVNHIDATYRTIPQRDSRGITGFSRGGNGALHLALAYPEIFGVAVSQATPYSRGGSPYWKAEYALMNDLDPYLKQPVRLNGIKLVHGRTDATIAVDQARIFDKALTDLGIDHVYVEHDGDHIFIPEESLQFLSDRLSREATTAVLEEYLGLPASPQLEQNYPNPFNNATMIRYQVAEPGFVRLDIFSLTGQQVRTLVQGLQTAGAYQVLWDGDDEQGIGVSTGIYLARFQVGDFTEVSKMMLMK